jgi:hypothetical protein
LKDKKSKSDKGNNKYNNAMRNIKNFYIENKFLTYCFIICLIIYLSYQYTMDMPEIIPGIEIIYNLLSNLSLAFMGSFIFYIVQFYVPYLNKKRKIKANLNFRIGLIVQKMGFTLEMIKGKYILNIDSADFMTDEDLVSIAKNISFEDMIQVNIADGLNDKVEIKIYDFIIESNNEIEKTIDKIFLYYSDVLDKETLNILDTITNSYMFRILPKLYNTIDLLKSRWIDNDGKRESKERESLEIFVDYYCLYESLKQHKLDVFD